VRISSFVENVAILLRQPLIWDCKYAICSADNHRTIFEAEKIQIFLLDIQPDYIVLVQMGGERFLAAASLLGNTLLYQLTVPAPG